MISAVALGLLPVAEVHIALWQTVLWMLIGVGVFLPGDYVVDKRFAGEGAGEAMGIVVGSVVEGCPNRSSSASRSVSARPSARPSWAAAFDSIIPQAIAPSADLATRGWGPARLGRLWLLVVLGCGLAAGLGYLLTTNFWSEGAYDPQTGSELQTSQSMPSTNNKHDDLVINSDGSVDLYFGPTAPDGDKVNWIATCSCAVTPTS